MRYHLKVGQLMACVTLALALLGQAGCASHKEDAYRTSGQYREDKKLSSQVADALHNGPVYKYPDIQVNAYQGRVQLSGFVTTEDQKKAAGSIASQIPGVVAVENDLLLKRAPAPAVGGTKEQSP